MPYSCLSIETIELTLQQLSMLNADNLPCSSCQNVMLTAYLAVVSLLFEHDKVGIQLSPLRLAQSLLSKLIKRKLL